MIRDLKARPYLHERILDIDGEYIVSTPLRFLPVSEHSIAVIEAGALKLRATQMVLP